MPIRITQDCINCGACAEVCPNGGISKGHPSAYGHSAYVINQDMCTECVGFFAREQCVAICPIDCCIRNTSIVLTQEALFERALAIHANTGKHPTLAAQTSHFPGASGSNPKVVSQKWWERLFRRKAPIRGEEILRATD